MKTSEKKLLAISLTLLAFWATEGVLHRLDTSTTTITAVALMFLPGIGIMTWKDAQPRIPWGTVVLFGVGISLGTALLQTKGAVWLADIVVTQFGLKQATALFILGVMAPVPDCHSSRLCQRDRAGGGDDSDRDCGHAGCRHTGHEPGRHDHAAAIRGELWLYSGGECAAEHGWPTAPRRSRRATSCARAWC
jgi:hypothetical protein